MPARKLVDICKSPARGQRDIEFTARDNKVTVKSGRSRFTLATLPAREFPNVEDSLGTHKFTVKQGQLKRLIDRTGFAMAQQDVRYYLNGMLWELRISSCALLLPMATGWRCVRCPARSMPAMTHPGDTASQRGIGTRPAAAGR